MKRYVIERDIPGVSGRTWQNQIYTMVKNVILQSD
jgi:hypothetical protein